MAATASKLAYYKGEWSEKQRRHLLRRTLFGVAPDDYTFFKTKSMEQCVDELLRSLPLPPAPVYANDTDPVTDTSFVFAPYNADRDDDWATQAICWWISLMTKPQRNVTEKMVLFWHNHFPIEFTKVKDSRYAYQYISTLREHATGNFKQLLRSVTTAPGMLVYLNGNLNGKNSLNENYGRELQELFTAGKGPDSHYSEADVKAAAKVLTGWKDDKKKIGSYFDASAHVTEDKVFSAFYNNHTIKGRSGEEGALETDELISLICSQLEVSKFLCRKLYRWFLHSHIDEQVEAEVIAPLAELMRLNNYSIKPVLHALFTSAYFYNPGFIGGIFKSPADYFVGLKRELPLVLTKRVTKGKEQNLEGLYLLMAAMAFSGQYIGNPPNVAGWTAYYQFPHFDKNWVNSEYVSARKKWIKDFSFFDGLNKQPTPYMVFDYLEFLKQLPNPASAQALVADSVQVLCCVLPDAAQLLHLQQMLAPAKAGGQTWEQAWAAHKSKASDAALKTEVVSRLQQFFTAVMLMPEYQIM